MNTIKNTLSHQDDVNRILRLAENKLQDDFDCVLQLAEDELTHLKRDALLDPDSANDYLESKAALERVRASFDQKQIEPMTSEEYCKIGRARCPYCRSKDTSWAAIEVDSKGARQSITCNSCRMEWDDVYSLIGYEEIKTDPPVFVRDGTSDIRHPQEEEDR